ncbi:retrovirus-related pol polyprotein from transposon tnt 1-94, partial [Lasius niger]
MDSAVVRIEVLTRENYDTWKLQMQALLTKNDAWAYVSGDLQRPAVIEGDATTLAALENWKRGDSKAKPDIILSISTSELKLIKGCETSRQMWLKLESIYQSKGPARKARLLKQLTLLRIKDGADVREHVNKFFDTVDKLEEMEIEINKDLLSIILLYSMPSNFENFRCAIESRDELPTHETLRVKILEEYEVRRNESGSALQNAMFSMKNSQKKPKDIRKKSNEACSNDKSEFKFRCHKCHEIGHKAAKCDKRKKEAAKKTEDVSFFADFAFKAGSGEYRSWCLDSGATSHLANDIKVFTTATKFDGGKNLAVKELSVEPEVKQAHRSSAETWHRRLGHLNYKDLYAAWKKNRLRGIELPEVNDSIQCEICLKGKITAATTPKKSERKSDLLEIIQIY